LSCINAASHASLFRLARPGVTRMTKPHEQATVEGPFDWLFTSATDWGRLLIAAQEMRHADGECLDALLDARAEGHDPLSPDDVVKVRSLVRMMKGLDLDPDSVRRTEPELMPVLETACVGCTERARCDRELDLGTATANRAEFCPNTPRLNALLAVMAVR